MAARFRMSARVATPAPRSWRRLLRGKGSEHIADQVLRAIRVVQFPVERIADLVEREACVQRRGSGFGIVQGGVEPEHGRGRVLTLDDLPRTKDAASGLGLGLDGEDGFTDADSLSPSSWPIGSDARHTRQSEE